MSFLSVGAKWAMIAAVAASLGACSRNADELAKAGMGPGGVPGQPGAAVPGSPGDFAQNVGDRVFFETDSTELTAQAQATLDKQAQWLSRYPRHRVALEGHADERGTREYNFALGAKRAEVVRDYLVARGVDASRLRTTSFGKERPVAVCNDISCWSQNRRVVSAIGGEAGT